MTRALAAAAALVAAVATGCHDEDPAPRAAAPTSSAPTTPAPTPTVKASTVPAPAPTGEISYSGIGMTLRLDVTEAQRKSAVPQDRAVEVLRKARWDLVDSPREIVLGVMTKVSFGAEDGSRLEGRLVWMVTVPDVPTRNGPCDVIVIADAKTGGGIGHWESCT